LNYCALNLSTDLLRSKDEYESFLGVFGSSIQILGSDQELLASKAPKTDEATALCKKIFSVCDGIVQFSVGIFKQDSASLLETLSQKLKSTDLENAEKCLMYIGYLSQPE
jgi:hypothetical protein